MKRITSILIFISAITSVNVFAQNDIQISNFMFCGQSFNPAFAGVSRAIEFSLLVREQWVGFKTAPSTQVINFKNSTENFGNYGLSLINDKLGYEKSLNVRLVYAYPFRLRGNSILSLGIGVGFINRSLDGTELIYENQWITDPNGLYSLTNEYNPTIDFGGIFTNQKLTLGLSSTHISKSDVNATFFNVPRHYYFYGDYIIKASEKINVVPAVYVKSDFVITQIEANANVHFADKFWLGCSYRVNESMVGLIGLRIFKNVKIAYAYDFNTGAVKTYSDGSHEIMIIASFDKPEKNRFYFRSPRLFN